MSDLRFSRPVGKVPLARVAERGGAPLPAGADPEQLVFDVAALDRAGPHDVTVCAEEGALDDLRATVAGACFVAPHLAAHVPARTLALLAGDPLRAFRRAATLFHPARGGPLPVYGADGISPHALVHDTAVLEPGILVDPGVVVGAGVEIGTGTTIGANTTIAPGVRIGRHCTIDAQVSIANALVGDRVIIHSGVRIGHGGPALDPISGLRAPFVGRVIIQNDVEIGANSAIERGHLKDTVIGDGASIGISAVVVGETTIDRLARFGFAAP